MYLQFRKTGSTTNLLHTMTLFTHNWRGALEDAAGMPCVADLAVLYSRMIQCAYEVVLRVGEWTIAEHWGRLVLPLGFPATDLAIRVDFLGRAC